MTSQAQRFGNSSLHPFKAVINSLAFNFERCRVASAQGPVYLLGDDNPTRGPASPIGRILALDKGKDTPKRVLLGAALYLVEERRLFAPSGKEVFLRAQSADVLQILVDHIDCLVTRDTLFDRLWRDVAVTDDSLTQCIRDIRKALGDVERQVLATVPKRGYTLRATLTPASAVPAEPMRDSGVKPDAATSIPAPPDAAHQADLAAQLDPRDVLPTLAVLPFRSDAQQEIDIFGIFLADEIAKLLGMAEDVNVISRLSTGTIGGPLVATSEARDTLNADFVLSGYLVRTGARVSLSLEFAEVSRGYVLWSDRMQVPFDPTHAETEGLDLVVANIRRAIMLSELRRVRAQPIENLKLFSILHGAVGLMHRFSPKDFQQAKHLLEHLYDRVPRHPSPLAWLARWHVLNAVQGWAEDTTKEAEAALDCTARALDLEPYHNLALVCEGQVLMHLARDLDAAEHRYDLALDSNPNDAYGRSLRGMLMAFSDRGLPGKRDTERALHLTPRDPHRFMFLALAAGVCIANEEFERALALTKESLRLNNAHTSSLRMLPIAYLGVGDGTAARQAASNLMALQPDFRVSEWLKASPSAQFENGRMFAAMLSELGIPT